MFTSKFPQGSEWADSVFELGTAQLDDPCLISNSAEGNLTNAMLLTWLLREDLQSNFDLQNPSGRRGLIAWSKRASRLDRSFLQRTALSIRDLAKEFLGTNGRKSQNLPGANLIGYGRGVLGMGEHVRMVGRAMRAAGIPNGIFDFTPGLGNRIGPKERDINWQSGNQRRCNLFHINADQMSRAFWYLGPGAFRNRYSIGYWAWELAKFPANWRPAIGFVDELWAPSKFIQKCFEEQTNKPVIHMPLCVDLPDVSNISRHEFGMDENEFVFVFAFDCHSYISRKNPQSIVKSFRHAFQMNESVRLVIKAMNADSCGKEWRELVQAASNDPRITLLNATWPRSRLLSLIKASNCYVSLHRCEGFGRGPAEAMLLEKPVIVTDYSGTQDFCRSSNSLLVGHQLVPVPSGHYPCSDDQVWAEPDIEQAARHMRTLFADPALAGRLARAGKSTIQADFSPKAIGKLYAARLDQLGMLEGIKTS